KREMKRCPTCDRVYEDNSMIFCLEDGATLVSDSAYDAGATVKIPAGRLTNQAPTEVLKEEAVPPTQPAMPPTQRYVAPPQVAPSGQKRSALPWILGAALILGLSAIAVAWILTRNGSDNSQVAQKNAQPENSPQIGGTPSATEQSVAGTTNMNAKPGVTSTPAIGTMSNTQSGMPAGKTTDTPRPTPPSAPTPQTETTPTRPSGPISGGVLNGKAVSLPKPSYPAIAKAVHASGTVTVQVTIDESGKVISAHAVGGHPLLQASAVQAAYQATFTPTKLSGQPVKVVGVITYNFVAQ
ncbi:MAG TPA: energy transducer TonB, partial [Pyrinomonadaceae bacterium]|nr:energy transducer TonB [Pyrinomonadaceae bacterium]